MNFLQFFCIAVFSSSTEHWTTKENATETATTVIQSTTVGKENASSRVFTVGDDEYLSAENYSFSTISTLNYLLDDKILTTSLSTHTKIATRSSNTSQLATTPNTLYSTISSRSNLVTKIKAAVTSPTPVWTVTKSYEWPSSLSLSAANFTLHARTSVPTLPSSFVHKEELTSPLHVTEFDRTTSASSSAENSSDTVSTTLSTFQTTSAVELNFTSEEYNTSAVSSTTIAPSVTNYSHTDTVGFLTSEEQRLQNKERSQFPGITLKVSHMLIPKQKRSGGYNNAQNMRIELPLKSPSKTGRRSNCTRFPVQVVTAADTESNEKVNLTEEHYDCEFSTDVLSTQKKDPPIRTYYGGYVFRYTIPKLLIKNSTINQTSTENTRTKETTTIAESDDYDSSYVEYSDTTNYNATGNTSG